jgi:hypothetical protein
MRRIFWGFCINRSLMSPLHLSSRSDFDFKFAEIFVIEKRLPELPDSGSRQDCQELLFFYKLWNDINIASTLHPRLIFCQICPLMGWLSRLKFSKSMINLKKFRIATPTRRVGESTTLRLAESGSKQNIKIIRQRLPDSPSRRVVDSRKKNYPITLDHFYNIFYL